ncbi:DUF1127 domain-containing protein [Sulfitobacter sp. MF3-043]|uniref:DUF1127 domain-containing protein n=1 Tax=Sulfitobacter sediminivivens TaxID=3252902 RepID=UPI0036D9CBCD
MTHALTLSSEMLATINTRGMPIAALLAVKFAVCVTKWATRRRTRMALRKLESWQLRDVGLTPDQAETEACRVFWKP